MKPLLIIATLALAGCDGLPALIAALPFDLPTPEEFCAMSDATKAQWALTLGATADGFAAACETATK